MIPSQEVAGGGWVEGVFQDSNPKEAPLPRVVLGEAISLWSSLAEVQRLLGAERLAADGEARRPENQGFLLMEGARAHRLVRSPFSPPKSELPKLPQKLPPHVGHPVPRAKKESRDMAAGGP